MAATQLSKDIQALIQRAEYNPTVREIAAELHDIFEDLLIEVSMNNCATEVDGRAVLAICMKAFKEIDQAQSMPQGKIVTGKLPSERFKQK